MASTPNERTIHRPISGGCLCGAVRYRINFPVGSRWPPDCRKWTGALVLHLIAVKESQIDWSGATASSASQTPFTEYNSSPGCFRGFCSTCGSTLFWRSDDEKPSIEVCTGTVDEKWLLGERESESSMARIGGMGKELATPSHGMNWYQNVIEGVTDGIVGGTRYVETQKLGQIM
ncbi:MAG: hypothetical protein M1837_004767 [Sclerophora amabilis]|nr:MAG: hypothetical protein M1837_004767 [Sclerophora amabilis]